MCLKLLGFPFFRIINKQLHSFYYSLFWLLFFSKNYYSFNASEPTRLNGDNSNCRWRARTVSLTGIFLASLIKFKTSHSQIVMTFQPNFFNTCRFSLSRSTFRENLFSQNSILVFGVVERLHPSCRCQKHPWIKITVLYFARTISGLPGSNPDGYSLWLTLPCSLNRYLSACRSFRTTTSGLVSVDRIWLIFQLRCSFDILSVIVLPLINKGNVSETVRHKTDY